MQGYHLLLKAALRRLALTDVVGILLGAAAFDGVQVVPSTPAPLPLPTATAVLQPTLVYPTSVLRGSAAFADPSGAAEGLSTFRWMLNGTVLSTGIVAQSLLLPLDGTLNSMDGQRPARSQGLAFVNGRFGQAVQFRPSARSRLAYLTAGNADPNEGTFEVWVNFTYDLVSTNYNGYPDLLVCDLDSAHSLNIQVSGGSVVLVNYNNGQYYGTWVKPPGWRAGEWHYLAATWSATANQAAMYYDGILVATSSYPAFPGTPATFNLGSAAWGAEIDAALDEVRFSRRPLTSDEIAAAYHRQAPTPNDEVILRPGRSAVGDVVTFEMTPRNRSGTTGTPSVASVTIVDNQLPAPADFYVSSTGNDTSVGTLAAPFATLERARTAIRNLKSGPGLPAGGVTVWLRGGVYTRTNTFELSASDAGTPSTPITWRGYPGEEARVVGAARLDPSWFTTVLSTSRVWNRLDPSAQGQVVQADLAAHGITNYATLQVRGTWEPAKAALELFFTNAPMPLARWPDPDMNDPEQTCTNSQLTLFGNPGPLDVTGLYVQNGVADGVNQFTRVGQVNGKQYNLYRYTFQWQGTWSTAWYLTTTTAGLPAWTDPAWVGYTIAQEIGLMSPISGSGATGTVWYRYVNVGNNDDIIWPPGQAGATERFFHGFTHINSAISTNGFTYVGTRPGRWTQAEEPWFHGSWYWTYEDGYAKATSIDTNTSTIRLGKVPFSGIRSGQLYYALNLLEEITQPGEWYLNRTDGKLYFWPPASLAGADIYVSLLEAPLWRLTDTTDLTVQDVTFDMNRADLVVIEDGARNTLVHCVLRNAGNWACRVSGTINGLSSCEITRAGDGGVYLSGGDRLTLTPAGDYVRNCRIHDCSRWVWTQPAVYLADESVGLSVTHNLIYEVPSSAVDFGRGNDHDIAFNDIHDIERFGCDGCAGVHTWWDWAARGTTIRYNFIHDISSPFSPLQEYPTQGIYLDTARSGIQVFGNVLYNVADTAIDTNGGRDNLVENNVIAKCGIALNAGSFPMPVLELSDAWTLWQDLQKLPYQGPIWSNAYPPLAAIPNNWAAVTNGNWLYPQGCVFSRNLGFGNANWMHTHYNAFTYFKEIANNLANSDPLFVDEANRNLTLRPTSPAYTIPGFQPIPFDQIGLESNKTLTVRIQGGGGVTAAPSQADYYPMQFVYLSAVPSNYWSFSSWTGDAVGSSKGISVCMTNDLRVTAVFMPFVTRVTWASPADLVYGTALGEDQLSATANVPGTFAYSPPAGTKLNAGSGQTLSVAFTPTDTANYSNTTATASVNVLKAVLTVKADDQSKVYGGANPAFTGTVNGVQNQDNITATYGCTATPDSPAGTYPIVPSLVDPDARLSNYTVVLDNGTLTITSITPARLGVSLVERVDGLFLVLDLRGQSGKAYQIQVARALDPLTSWQVKATITLVNASADWTDPDPLTQSSRFYRALLLP
jgi:hypothetical protein